MKKKLTNFLAVVICIVFSTLCASDTLKAAPPEFSDVPSGHWAYEYVYKLRELHITEGIGNNEFGLGRTITRAEFAAFVCKIMDWEIYVPQSGSFTDNMDTSAWYYPYVETALRYGAAKNDSTDFRPLAPVTREEMAVMIVRALGYDDLAGQLAYLGSSFADVARYTGYITIAKDLGIVTGTNGLYMPFETASREQAAAIIARLYEIKGKDVEYINGFYAINSAGQMNAVTGFDSISFGWCRLELDHDKININVTSENGNVYNIPAGWETPYEMASGGVRMLMPAVSEADAARIISDANLRRRVAELMAAAACGLSDGNETIEFDGIVVDFEAFKGKTSADNFNIFLSLLRIELDKHGMQMYVAVHPQRREGHEYYDGYDYNTIGRLADKVLLMAHDYNAKRLTQEEMEQGIVMTPLAPIEEIYYALQRITDADTGVSDKSKIVLQISFSTAQWKLINGTVINERPYTPDYTTLASRIRSGVEVKYSTKHESPYITFYSAEDQTDNVVWYEDERSVSAKIKLASLFGVTGVSVWRLGTVPDNGGDIYLDVLKSLIN